MNPPENSFLVAQSLKIGVGGASAALASVVAWQEHIDFWLRTASTAVAVGIGFVALLSMVAGLAVYIRNHFFK